MMCSRKRCAILLSVLVLTAAAGSAHAACGGKNQRPCTVLERIPSCDAGLVEDFAKNLCVQPARPAPPKCGGLDQRPCTLTERIPSCDPGLLEDFGAGLCKRPNAEMQRALQALERNADLPREYSASLTVIADDLFARMKPVLGEIAHELQILESRGVTPQRVAALAQQGQLNQLAGLIDSRGMFERLDAIPYPSVDSRLVSGRFRLTKDPRQLLVGQTSTGETVLVEEPTPEPLILQAVTLGVAGDLSFIGGATGEIGILIPKTGALDDYWTATLNGGLTVGADLAFLLTIYWLPPSPGISHAFVVTGAVGPGVGGTASLILELNPEVNGRDSRWAGLAVGLQTGASVEFELGVAASVVDAF